MAEITTTRLKSGSPTSTTKRHSKEAIRSHDGDEHSQSWAISNAYSYFKAETNRWLNGDPESRAVRADALEEALTEHLQIAVINLDQNEKPHIIFETLNARGEPLKQSDLVKNTVMYEANVIDDSQKARRLWGMFDDQWWRKDTGERLKRIHIDRFLNYWIVMRTLKEVTADRVASEFRNYVDARNKEEDGQTSIQTVATEIKTAGLIYKDLEEVKISEIETFLKRMKVMGLGVVTPLLLWLYTSKVLSEQLSRSVKALESCLVRRMLCGLQSQGLNKWFIVILNMLEKPGSDYDSHASSTIIEWLGPIWPNDHELRDNLITKPMRGTVARKKMVFEAIETSLRSEMSEPLGVTDKLTVEHIMPQKWEKNWRLAITTGVSNEDAVESRNHAIETIGNLTLITGKLNSNLSNGTWIDKREALYKHSTLFLNKTLLENAPDFWDEDAITERSKYLTDKIFQIWPSADRFAESAV